MPVTASSGKNGLPVGLVGFGNQNLGMAPALTKHPALSKKLEPPAGTGWADTQNLPPDPASAHKGGGNHQPAAGSTMY